MVIKCFPETNLDPEELDMEKIQTDKTPAALKPFQPLGVPMLGLLLGIAASVMVITALYEYFF